MRKKGSKDKVAEEIRSLDEIVSDLKSSIQESELDKTGTISPLMAELNEFVSYRVIARKKLARFIGVVLALLMMAVLGLFLMLDRNDALKYKIEVLESRDAFLHTRDSLYDILLGIDSTRTITYQVRDSVPISYPQLVRERDSLQSRYYSLFNEREQYRIKLEMITRNYPITIKEEGNYYVLHAEKVDSAMMLLNLYRDRIRFDPDKNIWIVER